MGITNSNKVINQERIDCDGSLRVTLALTAAPDIITNPTDIALVLQNRLFLQRVQPFPELLHASPPPASAIASESARTAVYMDVRFIKSPPAVSRLYDSF